MRQVKCYILQPEIFGILATQSRGVGGEIQLTDAMIALAKTQAFYGLKFAGESYDCGSKIGFLAAISLSQSEGGRSADRRRMLAQHPHLGADL